MLDRLPSDLLTEVLGWLGPGERARSVAYLRRYTNCFLRPRPRKKRRQAVAKTSTEFEGLRKLLNATFSFKIRNLHMLLARVEKKADKLCFECLSPVHAQNLCSEHFCHKHRHELVTLIEAVRALGRTSYPVPRNRREQVVVLSYTPVYHFLEAYRQSGWEVVQRNKWERLLWRAGAFETGLLFLPRFNNLLYYTTHD